MAAKRKPTVNKSKRKQKVVAPNPTSALEKEVVSPTNQFFINTNRDKTNAELATATGLSEETVAAYLASLPKGRKRTNFEVTNGITAMTSAQSEADDRAPKVKQEASLEKRVGRSLHKIFPDEPMR